jgi:hypothetical protein
VSGMGDAEGVAPPLSGRGAFGARRRARAALGGVHHDVRRIVPWAAPTVSARVWPAASVVG